MFTLQFTSTATVRLEALKKDTSLKKRLKAVLKALAYLEINLRACSKSSSLSQKALIFEHRSAVYIEVNEQRSAKNRWFMAKIGDFEQALRHPGLNTHKYTAISGPDDEEIFEAQ